MAASNKSIQESSKGLRVTPQKQPYNLLSLPWLKAFLKSRWFPAILTYPTLVLFTYIVYTLLWGPEAPSANLGTSLTWVLWWPLIPVFMFVLGRFWCAICPFATTIDLVQKVAGLGRPVPPFLKKYGIWIIDAVFILITWSDHVFGIVESPRGSGYLLGLMVTGVVVTGVLFERRAWCRYVCFLGGLSGNYSRSSALELRATPEICATCKTQNCYKGDEKTPGCPVFEFPRTMQNSANCNLCANCIKTCPNDSIRLSPRTPTRELWFMARPKFEESFLAVVIVGIVLIQNVTMLSFWEPTMETLTGMLLGSRTLAFTAIFLVAMALPFGLVAVASKFSGAEAGESFHQNFARFGYAIIPLDLAVHIAHNMFHLLAEGKSIYYNVAALFGSQVTGPAALLSSGTIQVLQFITVGLGVAGAMFTAYKIAGHSKTEGNKLRTFWPHLAVITLFGIVNVYLFTLPMMHRV
ncbi:MAG TPA: 4Fe-4S binding protein [Symbiobacteriaceae bacterium]